MRAFPPALPLGLAGGRGRGHRHGPFLKALVKARIGAVFICPKVELLLRRAQTAPRGTVFRLERRPSLWL